MKRLLTTALGVAMMMLMTSAAFAFTSFPPGNPPGTCPDTMTIVGLKQTLNLVGPCNPQTPNTTGTPGDSVLGVGGIVIGFDEIPTGFDVYIEMSGGGPLVGQSAGLDVFTHGTNFRPSYGFNLGDSIVVEYARVSNFFGDVELEAPNNNFSNPNIVLRKVSSGNPLPPFFAGNTTDFKETPTNTYIAPYMTTLVALSGPVRVARLTGVATHGMLVVRDAAPSDSVFIDYNKLTTIVPPAVGTVLQSISGIVNSAARGWRIMPRNSGDVVDTQPPGVTDAYAVADDQYRVVFDRPVTPASATVTTNYTLDSFASVSTAAMDGASAVILTITGGPAHGASEQVNVSNVVGVANGIGMTTTVHSPFIAGVLSCGEMSAPNPDSLAATPCRDVSRFVGSPAAGVGSGVTGQYSNGPFGKRSSVTGIVCGIYGNLYYMEDDVPASNRGITVFAPPSALVLGHRYVLAGNDEEFYSENEFAGISFIKDVGTPGVPAAAPLTVAVAAYDTCDGNQNLDSGRDHLSDLVSLSNVKVVQRFPTLPTTGFHVVGPTDTYADTMFVENQNNVLGAYATNNPNYPPIGELINVQGCVHYTTNTSTPSFRVCPRNAGDITQLGLTGVPQSHPKLSFSVYPNPARTVNVSFSLPTRTNVQVGVYDIVGRRVATIASGMMPAGSYQKVWHGVDDNGSHVRPGMYFYRLRAGNDVRTTRTILIGN